MGDSSDEVALRCRTGLPVVGVLGGLGAFESQGLTASSAGVRPGHVEVISSISVRGSSSGAMAIVLVSEQGRARRHEADVVIAQQRPETWTSFQHTGALARSCSYTGYGSPA